MLSKGGKKSYCCPECNSPKIANTKGGVSKQITEIYLPTNSFVCYDCGTYGPWKQRVKLAPVPGDKEEYQIDHDFAERLEMGGTQVYEPPQPILKTFTSKKIDGVDVVKAKSPEIRQGDEHLNGLGWSPKGQDDLTHWTHGPADFGIWVAYNSWRFKDRYDIFLKDGSTVKNCYPNASYFTDMNTGTSYCESEILAVRLIPYEELSESWLSGGETKEESDDYRSKRNSDMFADTEDLSVWEKVKPLEYDIGNRKVVGEIPELLLPVKRLEVENPEVLEQQREEVNSQVPDKDDKMFNLM